MASKRHVRRRECGDKKGFSTLDEAMEARRKAQRQGRNWITHYRCKWCGKYHIGHTPHNVRTATANRMQRDG
jgi:hypothetical protein